MIATRLVRDCHPNTVQAACGAAIRLLQGAAAVQGLRERAAAAARQGLGGSCLEEVIDHQACHHKADGGGPGLGGRCLKELGMSMPTWLSC